MYFYTYSYSTLKKNLTCPRLPSSQLCIWFGRAPKSYPFADALCLPAFGASLLYNVDVVWFTGFVNFFFCESFTKLDQLKEAVGVYSWTLQSRNDKNRWLLTKTATTLGALGSVPWTISCFAVIDNDGCKQVVASSRCLPFRISVSVRFDRAQKSAPVDKFRLYGPYDWDCESWGFPFPVLSMCIFRILLIVKWLAFLNHPCIPW